MTDCPPGQPIPPPTPPADGFTSLLEVVCDVDNNVCIEVIKLVDDATGNLVSLSYYDLDGTPLVAIPANLGPCNDHWNTEMLCEVTLAGSLPVFVHYHIGCGGGIIAADTFATNLDGTPYVGPIAALEPCAVNPDDFEQLAICDVNPLTGAVIETYLVRTVFDPDTGVITTTFVSLTTGLPYVPVGVARFCGEGVDVEQVEICVQDTSTLPIVTTFSVLLHTQYLAGVVIANYITALDNTITPIPGWGTTIIPSSGCEQTGDDQEVLGCLLSTPGVPVSMTSTFLVVANPNQPAPISNIGTWNWTINIGGGITVLSVDSYPTGPNPLPIPYPPFPPTLPGGVGWTGTTPPGFPYTNVVFPQAQPDLWAVLSLSNGQSVWFYLPYQSWPNLGPYPFPVQSAYVTTTGTFPADPQAPDMATGNGGVGALDLDFQAPQVGQTVKIIQRRQADGSYQIVHVYEIDGTVAGGLVEVPVADWAGNLSLGPCVDPTRHVEEICYQEGCTDTPVFSPGLAGPATVVPTGVAAGGSLVNVSLDFNGNASIAQLFFDSLTTCDGASLAVDPITDAVVFPASACYNVQLVGDAVLFTFDLNSTCPFVGDCCANWDAWFVLASSIVNQTLIVGPPIVFPNIAGVTCHGLDNPTRLVEGVKTITAGGVVSIVLHEADGTPVTRVAGDSFTLGACPEPPVVTHPLKCGVPSSDTGQHNVQMRPGSSSAIPFPAISTINFQLPFVNPASLAIFAGDNATQVTEPFGGGWVAGPATSQGTPGQSTYEYALLGFPTHVIPDCADNVVVNLTANVQVDFIDNPALPVGGANINVGARWVDVTNLAAPGPTAFGFINLAGAVGTSAFGVLTIPFAGIPPITASNLGLLIVAETGDAAGEFARVTITSLDADFQWGTDNCVEQRDVTLTRDCVQENVLPICWTDGISGDQNGILVVRTYADGSTVTEALDVTGRPLANATSWVLGSCAAGGAQTCSSPSTQGGTITRTVRPVNAYAWTDPLVPIPLSLIGFNGPFWFLGDRARAMSTPTGVVIGPGDPQSSEPNFTNMGYATIPVPTDSVPDCATALTVQVSANGTVRNISNDQTSPTPSQFTVVGVLFDTALNVFVGAPISASVFVNPDQTQGWAINSTVPISPTAQGNVVLVLGFEVSDPNTLENAEWLASNLQFALSYSTASCPPATPATLVSVCRSSSWQTICWTDGTGLPNPGWALLEDWSDGSIRSTYYSDTLEVLPSSVAASPGPCQPPLIYCRPPLDLPLDVDIDITGPFPRAVTPIKFIRAPYTLGQIDAVPGVIVPTTGTAYASDIELTWKPANNEGTLVFDSDTGPVVPLTTETNRRAVAAIDWSEPGCWGGRSTQSRYEVTALLRVTNNGTTPIPPGPYGTLYGQWLVDPGATDNPVGGSTIIIGAPLFPGGSVVVPVTTPPLGSIPFPGGTPFAGGLAPWTSSFPSFLGSAGTTSAVAIDVATWISASQWGGPADLLMSWELLDLSGNLNYDLDYQCYINAVEGLGQPSSLVTICKQIDVNPYCLTIDDDVRTIWLESSHWSDGTITTRWLDEAHQPIPAPFDPTGFVTAGVCAAPADATIDIEHLCAEIVDPLLGYAVPVDVVAKYVTFGGITTVTYTRADTGAPVFQPLTPCGEYDLAAVNVCYLETGTGIARRGLQWFRSRNGIQVSSYVTDLTGATVTGTIVPCGRRCRTC